MGFFSPDDLLKEPQGSADTRSALLVRVDRNFRESRNQTLIRYD
jgi:hypothetical protein